MISTKTIEDKANTKIAAGSLSDLEYAQITSVNASFTSAANKVATFSALPAASTKKGVIYYVISERIYYFSDGVSWRTNFTSSSGNDANAGVATGWGVATDGRLGDGTTTNKSSPVTLVGSITNWSQISGGANHSLGVSRGIAYGWGSGSNGRLGDNTTTDKSSPVTLIGGITTWSQVSAGGLHSLGVTSTGIAYAWGYNGDGRLGNNATTDRSSPVTVIGGITNWSQVSASHSTFSNRGFSLGVTSSGIAYGWGLNQYGRLGDNTTTARSSPVTVVGGITTWSQVSAAAAFSLGVTSGGVAYGWGQNYRGNLGDGTTSSRSSPVVVVGSLNWSQVSGGAGGEPFPGSSIGITSTGIAYGWGYNGQGQLGDNTATNRLSPVTVVGGITNWTQVSSGSKYVLGRTSAGIVYAWGEGTDGKLGNGTTTTRSSPGTVVGGITTWTQISAGPFHGLGISSFGQKGFI